MKKEHVIFLSLVIISSLVVALFCLSNISAIDIDPTNEKDPLGIGVNADSIPQSPEEGIGYLEGRWLKLLNNTRAGKVSTFFTQHPLPFKILFNTEYSFTGLFFWIFFSWIFIFGIASDFYRGFNFGGTSVSLGLGALTSMALAWVGFLRAFANFLIFLISKPEGWWMRILVTVIILVVFLLVYGFNAVFASARAARKKEAEEKSDKLKIEEHEEFIKGVEEGRKLTEPIRKIKKKISDIDF